MENSNRYAQADRVYLDLIDFFQSKEKRNYLFNLVPPTDIYDILEDLEKIFIDQEMYEKCKRVQVWRKKMDFELSPDVSSNHLY